MKITFIIPALGLGGGTKIVFEYANHLVDKGHDVSIIYPLLGKDYGFKFYNIKKIIHYVIGILIKLKQGNSVDWFNLKANLIRVLTLKEKYIPNADIIVATWWETAYLINKYNKNKGSKFYLIQGYEIFGGPPEKVHQSYELNLHKIVIAKWLYEKLTELGVSKNLEYIPNGIDFSKYKLINDIKNRPKRVAMLYHEASHKGSLDGIKSLIIAKKEYPDLQAVLFGVFPRPDKLPKWIEYVQNPMQDKLIEEIYNGSSTYLCPSLTEGWHLPPAEAMACGCSLISTNIGGVKDYAINKKTALLSPPGKPLLLAKNLIMLLKDDTIRLKLAYAGNDYIQNFKWDKSVNKLEKLFKKYI